MSLDRTDEVLEAAIRILAVFPGKIKDRLITTFSHLQSHLREDQIPEGVFRVEFHRLMEQVKELPSIGDEGKIQTTISAMTEDEAVEVADKLRLLFLDVREKYVVDKRSHE